ncbi:radical SAM protein [Burkholderia sp. JP2-270]|uniref:B12-binding domain-containing radical SAM protein n=1 Tax=Burkholderia sp. JP2-270 TaxID=2217913 RepID=UPI0013A69F32|nr:radical SAM protein [Burkholderia sp. JP2-270]
MYSFVPIGLLSLAAVIRQSGLCEALLFDINDAINDRRVDPAGEFYCAAAELICSLEPDVVGFMTECDSYHHVLQICAEIRRFRPSAVIILGGPHASTTAAVTLARWNCIDAICVGEGERTVLPLVESLLSVERRNVPGAVLRSRNGEILNGGPAHLVDDLDSLPVPAFEMYEPKEDEEIFLEVGRGCPFACTFCSTAPYWERRHRVKSPQRIVAELSRVENLYGPRRFHFTHDLFTTDRRWALAVSEAIALLDAVPAWTCSARADRVDPELLQQMAKGGCNAIYYGVESGSSRILTTIKKEIPWDVTLRAIDNSISVGIQANAGLVVGFPEDDEDSVRETFDAYTQLLARGAKPVHIFGFCPFNGAASFDAKDLRGTQKHFLDIPLPSSVDTANRQLIVDDPVLFSVYRRLATSTLRSIAPGFIEGIDEFTPLVESCLLPSLIFVGLGVSMLDLYKGWLSWISARNEKLDRPEHRRFYGGALQYATYLFDRAQQLEDIRPDLVPYLDLLQRSFASAASTDLSPLSMATYRSGVMPPDVLRSRIEEGCLVAAEQVVGSFDCEWDLSELLAWTCKQSIPAPRLCRCGYVLQRTGDQSGVRLLQVAPAVLELLESLRHKPLDAASLWAERVHEPCLLTAAGIDGVVQTMVEAGGAGLVRIQ